MKDSDHQYMETQRNCISRTAHIWTQVSSFRAAKNRIFICFEEWTFYFKQHHTILKTFTWKQILLFQATKNKNSAAFRNQNLSFKKYHFMWKKHNKQKVSKSPLCITASGNTLASGNISLKLFMAPLETIELLTFWYVVAEHHFAQL